MWIREDFYSAENWQECGHQLRANMLTENFEETKYVGNTFKGFS